MHESTPDDNQRFMESLEVAARSVMADSPVDAETIDRRLEMRKVLNQIWEAWIHTPNLRLGQLIHNASILGFYKHGTLFYMKDQDLIESIRSVTTPWASS